jgi:phosphoribosylanthranilate isomerase
MWVKICANTNLEDALLAAELGADAVGFVFAPSLRQVTPAQVALITPHLPPTVEHIGVFPAWEAGAILEAVREAGLSGVQLHGGLDLALVQKLRQGLPDRVTIIQTLHWKVDGGTSTAAVVERQLQSIAATPGIDRVLIDSKVGAATGGTGVAFDWSAAAAIFACYRNLNLVLAGGLQPHTVADAVDTLRPWGVDVASGVEVEPGRKDREKLSHFITQAKNRSK